MALDPSIIMGFRGAQVEPPANALVRALQLQGMIQQNALAKAQFEESKQTRDLQQQQMRNALLQQQRQQAAIAALPSPRTVSAQNALAGGGGPTVGNAQRMAPVDPRAEALHRLLQGGAIAPDKYIEQAYPKREFMVVGNNVLPKDNPAAGPVYTAPDAPPEVVRMMNFMNTLPANDPRRAVLQDAIRKQTTHAPGISVSYGAPVAGQDAQGNPVFFQPSKDGKTPPAIVPGVQPPPRVDNLTEGQAKAVQFASRMVSADKILAELAEKGTSVSVPGSMQNNVVGDVMTAISTKEGQRLNQAKRDFVNAILRRESGAVISPEEFANANRQYFPQIGDSKEVIAQKAENRRIAIEGMRADVPKGKQGEVDRIAAPPGAPKRIQSDAEYNALPSGATFIAPDGTTRRKP